MYSSNRPTVYLTVILVEYNKPTLCYHQMAVTYILCLHKCERFLTADLLKWTMDHLQFTVHPTCNLKYYYNN